MDEAAQLSCMQLLDVLPAFPTIRCGVLVGDPRKRLPFAQRGLLQRAMVLRGALVSLLAAGAPSVTLIVQHRLPSDFAHLVGLR